MNKTAKYYGIFIFLIALILVFFGAYRVIVPKYGELTSVQGKVTAQKRIVTDLREKENIVKNKLKQRLDSIFSAQKKIYSPVESDLNDEDTLFFTLYNDVIEMLHANSIKIKSIDYKYNPETDAFVKSGKDVYFVCDVNMELVSNYVNLGKLIQDIYQYPYYIKINDLVVNPYKKDKKILLSSLSLRLYAHTIPDEPVVEATSDSKVLDGAETALPQ